LKGVPKKFLLTKNFPERNQIPKKIEFGPIILGNTNYFPLHASVLYEIKYILGIAL